MAIQRNQKFFSDAGIPACTVRDRFQILKDNLIGDTLAWWRDRIHDGIHIMNYKTFISRLWLGDFG